MSNELKIFLASSGTLSEERKAIKNFIATENNKLHEKGLFIKLVIWEELDHSIRKGRIQDYFNKEMLKCDMVIAVFFDRVGEFTKEEFETAWKSINEEGAIQHLYIYFKDAPYPKTKGIWKEIEKIEELQEKIESYGQIYSLYETDDELKLQLGHQLERILPQYLPNNKPKKDHHDPTKESDVPENTRDISTYLEWIKQRCSQIDLQKLAREPVIVDLPELFVPLYADDPNRSIEKMTRESNDLSGMEKTDTSPVDIEKLVQNNEYLLIEGEPGCGKTTLLKQIALKMIKEEGSERFHLPVLIFLRDCVSYLKEQTETFTGDDFLEHYFIKHQSMLNMATVEEYCKKLKIRFLIDGLDEVPDDRRNDLIDALAEFRLKHNVPMVLTGRKHGVVGKAMEWFGKKYTKVHPFNEYQIAQFITKWCNHVFVKSPVEGRKTAGELIAELKTHEAVKALIENPLMLTTVSILYYEGEKLPEQRAELYRKFVENLIYRRFAESDRILEVLKGFGFKMQESGEKGIDRNDALAIVKKTFIQQKNETDLDYKCRINKLFDDLEPRCGLLRLENGHYRFWHLTFQEYLAAEHLIAGSENLVEAIEPYLTKEQYKETVRLYIGCLSLNQKTAAAKIIRNVIDRSDATSDELLLVGEALVDIKKERRDDHLVREIQERYWQEIEKETLTRKRKAGLGEIIGWLGDERDLKEFVGIEGGEYDLEDIGKTRIKPFAIGKYPVTNLWFEEFIEAGGYSDSKYWSKEGWVWMEEEKIAIPRYWNDRMLNCPNLPVVGVSWYEAQAFVNWLNVIKGQDKTTYALPTEQQWQAAAAGFERREYPWGNKLDHTKCNNSEGIESVSKTSPAGIFFRGNTPQGVTDMAGNVWEWTDTERGSHGVFRGGSSGSDARRCRCTSRNVTHPRLRDAYLGFRVALIIID